MYPRIAKIVSSTFALHVVFLVSFLAGETLVIVYAQHEVLPGSRNNFWSLWMMTGARGAPW